MKHFIHAAIAAAIAAAAPAPALAFLHEGHHGHGSHHTGCFVTTSPQHHTKGIRHWRNPCPHHERKHLNPYYPGYHRPDRPHPSPH